MTNARIERMIREVNAEPSAQFFGRLFGLIELLRPTARIRPQARLSVQ